MSYVKNTWATGDTITAEKLNAMEDGIANGVEPLDDDEMKTVLLNAGLFDAVCVVEEEGGVQVQKILSDESDNILMW